MKFVENREITIRYKSEHYGFREKTDYYGVYVDDDGKEFIFDRKNDFDSEKLYLTSEFLLVLS